MAVDMLIKMKKHGLSLLMNLQSLNDFKSLGQKYISVELKEPFRMYIIYAIYTIENCTFHVYWLQWPEWRSIPKIEIQIWGTTFRDTSWITLSFILLMVTWACPLVWTALWFSHCRFLLISVYHLNLSSHTAQNIFHD